MPAVYHYCLPYCLPPSGSLPGPPSPRLVLPLLHPLQNRRPQEPHVGLDLHVGQKAALQVAVDRLHVDAEEFLHFLRRHELVRIGRGDSIASSIAPFQKTIDEITEKRRLPAVVSHRSRT